MAFAMAHLEGSGDWGNESPWHYLRGCARDWSCGVVCLCGADRCRAGRCGNITDPNPNPNLLSPMRCNTTPNAGTSAASSSTGRGWARRTSRPGSWTWRCVFVEGGGSLWAWGPGTAGLTNQWNACLARTGHGGGPALRAPAGAAGGGIREGRGRGEPGGGGAGIGGGVDGWMPWTTTTDGWMDGSCI